MKLLKEDKISYLNLGLMFITAILAFVMPFETFLFAYAFLGPLHYLTEISWLHDRNYFAKGKYDFLVLLIIGIALSFAAFSADFGYESEMYTKFVEMNLFDKLLVFALISSILFALVKNLFVKIVSILLIYVFINGWLSPENATENQASTTVFALTSLVPTLIHVYVFTGLFMLFGALKARSKSGLWQMVGFVVFPILLVFYLPVDTKNTHLTKYGEDAYYAKGNGFFNTNASIMDHFNIGEQPIYTNKMYINDVLSKDANATPLQKKAFKDSVKTMMNKPFLIRDTQNPYYMKELEVSKIAGYKKNVFWNLIFNSTTGIMLMRFIAFAYLYHYLNWFSKTEVIRWHKVSKVRFILVIVLWLAACGFYIYDYSLGLSVLFFLSFTHVLLEFPLNIVSIIGIGKESVSIVKHGFKPLPSKS